MSNTNIQIMISNNMVKGVTMPIMPHKYKGKYKYKGKAIEIFFSNKFKVNIQGAEPVFSLF